MYKTYPLQANASTSVQQRRPSPGPENLSLVQTAALWRSHLRRSLKRAVSWKPLVRHCGAGGNGMLVFGKKKSHWRRRQAVCSVESRYLQTPYKTRCTSFPTVWPPITFTTLLGSFWYNQQETVFVTFPRARDKQEYVFDKLFFTQNLEVYLGFVRTYLIVP